MTLAPESRVAAAFTRFRGSKSFLIALLVFVASWLALHWLLRFDPDLGDYNAVLSTEASIALSAFAIVAERQYEMQKRQLDMIQRAQETVLAVAEAQHALLETLIARIDGQPIEKEPDADLRT